MTSRSCIASLVIPAVLGAAGLVSACTKASSSPPASEVSTVIEPYRIHEPDTVIRLPKRLMEISGLTWLGNGQIGAVNDEDGDLFVLDGSSGEVLDRIRFAGDGDYEGVELRAEVIYVLRSDGRLYAIRAWQSGQVAVERLESDVPRNCDAEGLAAEPSSGDLLIACKENPGKGLKGKKAMYRYRPESGKTDATPAMIIDALNPALTQTEGGASRALRRFFKIPRFKPSGVAVHPITGETYVVSSRSHGLAVFGPDGALRISSFLNPDTFPQPEGIAFAPDGKLYISSEGRSGRGILATFEYRPSSRP